MRVGRTPLPCAIRFCAKAMAPDARSPCTTPSISPIRCAVSISTVLADIMTCNARSAPIKRGNLWVPPAPGIRPKDISGMPIRASASATRQWAANAISAPRPMLAHEGLQQQVLCRIRCDHTVAAKTVYGLVHQIRGYPRPPKTSTPQPKSPPP